MDSSRTSLQQYVFRKARQGDIQNVVDVIDHYGWTKQWMMNVGDRKGRILDRALEKRRPKTILELGTFLGYSSLRMALRISSDAHIYSIEADPKSASIARSIHQFAGANDRITILDGYTEQIIPKLKELTHVDSFDFIFIDHHKAVYLRDLKLLENDGLIRSGTVIVADNVIYPGAPDYLEYIRKNSNYTSSFYEATLEYDERTRDGVEVSFNWNSSSTIMNQMFAKRQELKEYVLENARQGDVQNIVDTIDQYCWTKQWMMNIGDRKGKILDQALKEKQPKNVLELGTFLGYSSLRMILNLPVQSHIYSIEADQESATIAKALHQFAGVTDRITVINEYTDKVIPKLKEIARVDTFDFVFIDHYHDVYVRDLKLLEEYGLIGKGSVIAADNVIHPGAPEYLEYVRNNSNYTTTLHEGTLEYRDDVRDGIEISVRQ